MKINFNYINENQRKINAILWFILEEKQQNILKRLNNIRKTKAYKNFKETGTNKSFDIIGTDFKGYALELDSLQNEINIICEITNRKPFNILFDIERDFINKFRGL